MGLNYWRLLRSNITNTGKTHAYLWAARPDHRTCISHVAEKITAHRDSHRSSTAPTTTTTAQRLSMSGATRNRIECPQYRPGTVSLSITYHTRHIGFDRPGTRCGQSRSNTSISRCRIAIVCQSHFAVSVCNNLVYFRAAL